VSLVERRRRAQWLPTVEEVATEQARRSLRAFIEQAWPVLEPATPFVPGWHIDAIAEHLEAVTRGEIRDLVINIPPRHMKSLAVCVFWPMWEWITMPERRWLFASYASQLSIRDSLKCRRLMTSDWYERRWGHVVKLRPDQTAKQRFENTRTGYRLATSVPGTATGEGGDRVVVDDPHNVRDAESDTIRRATLEWWDLVMSTRLNDPKRGARVVVMQRVHQDDLTGHILARLQPVHLCLPAEFEGRRSVTVRGWTDPRTEPGELLWPARFGREELDRLKLQLGAYGTAGQLQQRPVPAGGGLFQRQWLVLIDTLPTNVAARCRFWDCAATPDGGDYTVGVRLAKTEDVRFVVEDVIRGQWSAGEVDARIRQTAQEDGQAVAIREEQEPGSAGKAVIDTRRRTLAGWDYKGIPSTGDKFTRWRPFAVQAEAGQVQVVQGPWSAAFIEELTSAPHGSHDDQLDAVAGAFASLTLGPSPGRLIRVSGY
jgi:predicted phage terminase large subunit-like protein